MTPFSFQRGETILLALDALEGDPGTVTAISANMKAVPAGRTMAPASAPVASSFTISSRAATSVDPAGWTLTISATQSAALKPGAYVADARLTVAGGVIITEPVAIRLREAVSA
jgi:hypothetical protein